MIVSGRTIAPEPVQDILMSLEMTNETKKRLDTLQGWAKDLKDAPPLSETPEFEYVQKLPKSLTQQPSSVLLDASQPHAMSSPSKKKEKNATTTKKFGDDFSQEQEEEEELDGDYVSPEQREKEEEERERKEAAMNHNGDVRMELKPRTGTEWLQGQKKRVRVEFEEESSSSEEETEADEEIIPTQRPSPNDSEDDDDAHLDDARGNDVGIMKRTLNAAVGMIETVVNIVRSPFKSPNKRARIENSDTPPPSPGIFGFGGSPFAKGIAMSPKSLAQVIDATGAAAGENNANVAKMEWGARGGETWQQKEEDEGEARRKRAARKKLVLDDDDENDEEEEHETVKKSPKKATGKPATSVMSEIASQVTEVASEANWEILAKLMAEREKQKKAPRELGLNVDRTRRMSRRM